MEIHLTLERETKNTVRFAEDDTGQPADHPGSAVIGPLILQKAAHAKLRAPSRPGPDSRAPVIWASPTNASGELGAPASTLTEPLRAPVQGHVRRCRRPSTSLVRSAVAPSLGSLR